MTLTFIKRNLWIAVAALGLAFVVAGLFMVSEGMEAKDLVRDRLIAEEITTSSSATIPDARVDSVATAESQEALITDHTLGSLGPYSGLERGSPERASYIDGVALRTALNMAIMGFRVSDLVIGIGAFVVTVGLANVLLLAPIAYLAGRAGAAEPGEWSQQDEVFQQRAA